ncbi:uncharacterized protein BDV17DRAFT_240866 [Aspergillus undulatus]|uniref:uncharacterized protein n=1 Tax=Aspergillus undulatus TaxID=1810928 RepID=UPI003CCCDBCB
MFLELSASHRRSPTKPEVYPSVYGFDANQLLVSGWAAGIEGLVRGLALDLKPLRVNMVSPGAVHTELFSRFPSEQLEGFLQLLKNQSATGTVGRPEDGGKGISVPNEGPICIRQYGGNVGLEAYGGKIVETAIH